jgi:hypothetical protein
MVDSNWQQMFYNLKFNAGTVTKLGFVLPKYGVLDLRSFGVYVNVVESGGTLAVGFINAVESGDEDGILVGVSLTNLGWVFPTITFTQGTNAQYVSATTYGVSVIPTAEKGGNVSGTNGLIKWDPWAFVGDGTIKTMTYTLTSATTTFKGVLTFRWRQLPDPAVIEASQWPMS